MTSILVLYALVTSVSPTEVLKKSEQQLGSRPVAFQYQPNDRIARSDDRTLAPYFHVTGDAETERLPLKETSAEVSIAGVIAQVKVRQVFANEGTKPIEAVYVFPASTRAAVHGMRMRIGQRVIEAKIDKKQAARESYEAAKEQGKRASLLEQERPNVFTMNVANIMPKDRIQVELEYSELLVPEDAVYEFVYPTVVGPRYGGGADPVKDKWIGNPYLTEGQKETYKFGIDVHLETAIPIKEVSSPSHKVKVKYGSPASADVGLDEDGGGNRDYVLRYRLAGDKVETGLLLYPGQKENFFALMMEPPQRPSQAQIPPREYIFLLDVSGSMHGYPLETAKVLMKNLLEQLRPTDEFDMVFFSGANYVFSPQSISATPANIQRAVETVGRTNGSGGTELIGGLTAVYNIPRKSKNLSRTVVVVTDGYVGVEAQAFKMVRDHLDEANLFAFGIGSAVNRGLIEGMARAGMGEPFVVLDPTRAQGEAAKLRTYIEKPVLTSIKLDFKGFGAYEIAPAKVPDLMARRPLVVFGKYKGDASGTIELTGYGGSGKIEQKVHVASTQANAHNAPLRSLWARKWVGILEDQVHLGGGADVTEAITDLGLQYTLLTPYTSFVAIDQVVTNRSGPAETVKQPLPLPQGVSNMAVGGNAESITITGGQTKSYPMHNMPAPAQQQSTHYYRSAPMKVMSHGGGGGGRGPQSVGGYGKSAAPKAGGDSLDGLLSGAVGGKSAGDSGGSYGGLAGSTVSRGHATSTPAVPAPPPAPKPNVTAAEKPARDSRNDRGEKGEEDEQTKAPRLMISHMQADGLGDTRSLVGVVESHLAKCSDGGQIKLRLTIDANGKIIKVDVLSGNGACLQKKLLGLTSATKPQGASGTLELTLR
jgi:Ca-activated chloride channel homolog